MSLVTLCFQCACRLLRPAFKPLLRFTLALDGTIISWQAPLEYTLSEQTVNATFDHQRADLMPA